MQANLLCGDYFKGSFTARSALKDMVKIIGWFLNHPRANALLQSQMAKPRTLKLPVKTRWGSQARLSLKVHLMFEGLRSGLADLLYNADNLMLDHTCMTADDIAIEVLLPCSYMRHLQNCDSAWYERHADDISCICRWMQP